MAKPTRVQVKEYQKGMNTEKELEDALPNDENPFNHTQSTNIYGSWHISSYQKTSLIATIKYVWLILIHSFTRALDY